MVAEHNQQTHGVSMLPEVLPLRQASRELVRELGFLQGRDSVTKLSHSHCHALIEVDARGPLGQSELPGLLRLDKSTTSRIVAELESRGLLRAKASKDDARARVLALTPKGRATLDRVHEGANARVEDALQLLGDGDRRAVLQGMQLYARALERARRRSEYETRLVEPRDRAAVARLIRTVMPEFGASGAGFAILDPEVDDMHAAYEAEQSAYWVVVHGESERVVGGGGFAPLVGGEPGTCELRKMYFMPEVRGLGLGQEVLSRCLDGARQAGFTRMYLETLRNMTQAKALYERNGFEPLTAPLGQTGHHGCNAFFARPLAP
jgi:putative acetyltransferase